MTEKPPVKTMAALYARAQESHSALAALHDVIYEWYENAENPPDQEIEAVRELEKAVGSYFIAMSDMRSIL